MAENPPSFFEKANNWIKNSVSIRIFTIGFLILLMLIPISMIENLIEERERRQNEATMEVSSKWGEKQTITGPVLTIPFRTYAKVFEGENSAKFKLVESRSYAHFLPEELLINGDVSPEVRYRGMYEVIVYNSKLKVSGTFLKPNLSEWQIADEDVIWEDAFISLGISDLRSIQENISLLWNKKKYFFNPGLESNDVIGNGISTRLLVGDSASYAETSNFSIDIDFNGSSSLNFIPLGKSSKVFINSKWKNPSFTGAFLPDKREIGDSGFSASWKVLHLNRPYPQSFIGPAQGIQASSFGVDLIVPVDEYQKSMRSAKYAVMFIALTFLFFFFVQILNGVKIHPIQYIIIGLALCVFYTLLIALSEHIAFSFSYLISSLCIIGMITLYARSIVQDKKLTIIMSCILILLYLFIFSIIQMEDYALLMGSMGLFVVLAIIMYLSRKINWYAIKTNGDRQ